MIFQRSIDLRVFQKVDELLNGSGAFSPYVLVSVRL